MTAGEPRDGSRDRPSPRDRRPAGRGRRPRSDTRPSQRSRAAEPARFAAYTLLRAVADGAYANLEMPRILRRRRLEGRDAAFATELAFGTVRLQGRYDPVIAAAAGRPVSAIDGPVLDVMRLGAHQLLGMRVPPHAAADQTVGLARSVVGQGAAGFVNAVMRRISERDLEAWLAEVVPDGGGPDALAVRHSHPEWIVKAMRGALLAHGRATADTVDAELEALLACDNEPPRVSLVARPGLATVAELLDSAEADPSATSPLGVVLRSGDPGRVAAVREGRAAVQDEGSQLLPLALAAAEAGPGLPARWLDLCAGPGGKAGVLGGLALDAGADLVAVEVSPHRADLVRATLAAPTDRAATLGRSVEVRTADGRHIGEAEPAAYARILVDAPCTGLGALRRRPEARWRRAPTDLATLGPLQRDLLRLGPRRRRTGGSRCLCHVQSAPGRDPLRPSGRGEEPVRRRDRRRPPAPAGAGRDAAARPGRGPDRPAVATCSRHRRDVPGGDAEGMRGMRIELWPMTEGDARQVGSLHHRAWRDAAGDDIPGGVQASRADVIRRWRDALAAPPPRRTLRLVARRDRHVVGFAVRGPARGRSGIEPAASIEVFDLLVERELHGSGVRQGLLDRCLRPGQAAQVWVWADDETAIAFYRRNGFAPDRSRPAGDGAFGLQELRLVRPG